MDRGYVSPPLRAHLTQLAPVVLHWLQSKKEDRPVLPSLLISALIIVSIIAVVIDGDFCGAVSGANG